VYIKTSELRQLDVINIEDGRFLGHVCDVDLHPDTGAIRCLILEGSEGGLLRFFKHDDLEIPWQEVVMIGIDGGNCQNRSKQSQILFISDMA